MKLVIGIRNVLSRLLDVSGILAGFTIVIIGFFVTWGVIARYFLVPSYWVEPYTVYLFVAASFLGGAYAMKKGEHIKVDLLLSKLSSKMRKVLDILTSILALVFFIYLSWRSSVMVMDAYERKTTDLSLIEVPLWIPQSFMALGAILMCLSLIWHMLNVISGYEEKPKSEIDK